MAAVLEAQDMTLGELLGREAGRYAELAIRDLASDSRDVRPGTAFVALPGVETHGLAFAATARQRGAVIVLYDPATTDGVPDGPSLGITRLRERLGDLARAFYGPRAGAVCVVGITGTNGKTTVAFLLAQALSALGRSCGYIGTLGFGVPPQLTPQRLTTPDCLSLHRTLAGLSVRNVALEVSSHALVQQRTAGIDLRHAVFTNLTHDHLDAHGDFERYGQAKTLLFTRREAEHAVLNVDDPFAATLRRAIGSRVHVLGVTSRAAAAAELSGTPRPHGIDGQDIEIAGVYGRARIASTLVGEFNASNLLLALGALLNLGVGLDDACAALGACVAPPGRMQVLGGGDAPHVVVDYAHTPDALERVLATLRAMTRGELWCVFGCGGERDTAKRAAMGRIAGAAEHVVLTDDNPRREDPQEIVAAIRTGLRDHPSLRILHDRRAAIALAIAAARAGDVVLVAGRGAERMQQFADAVIEFDDRVVAAALLEQRA